MSLQKPFRNLFVGYAPIISDSLPFSGKISLSGWSTSILGNKTTFDAWIWQVKAFWQRNKQQPQQKHDYKRFKWPTLYTHSSWPPSGIVVPSARMRLTKEKPNVLSPLSFSKTETREKSIIPTWNKRAWAECDELIFLVFYSRSAGVTSTPRPWAWLRPERLWRRQRIFPASRQRSYCHPGLHYVRSLLVPKHYEYTMTQQPATCST